MTDFINTNDLINIIKFFFKEKQSLFDIYTKLFPQLSIRKIYYYDSIRDKMISTSNEIYSNNNIFINNTILLILPMSTIAISIPLDSIHKLVPVNNIFYNNFKEKAIKINYYNNNYEINGPYMIVLNLDLDSLYFDKVKLISKINNSYQENNNTEFYENMNTDF